MSLNFINMSPKSVNLRHIFYTAFHFERTRFTPLFTVACVPKKMASVSLMNYDKKKAGFRRLHSRRSKLPVGPPDDTELSLFHIRIVSLFSCLV